LNYSDVFESALKPMETCYVVAWAFLLRGLSARPDRGGGTIFSGVRFCAGGA
jgi:hypothetical protein